MTVTRKEKIMDIVRKRKPGSCGSHRLPGDELCEFVILSTNVAG